MGLNLLASELCEDLAFSLLTTMFSSHLHFLWLLSKLPWFLPLLVLAAKNPLDPDFWCIEIVRSACGQQHFVVAQVVSILEVDENNSRRRLVQSFVRKNRKSAVKCRSEDLLQGTLSSFIHRLFTS